MNIKEIAKLSLDKLVELGVDRASVRVKRNFSSELQKEFHGIDLFRNVDEIDVQLKAIKDDKRGIHSFTYSEIEDIENNVMKVMNIASESNEDKAYGMAKNTKYQNKFGIDTPDTDAMYKLLADFAVEKEEDFPQISETTSIVFYKEEVCYLNNLGSEIEYSNGFYQLLSLFSAAQDGKHSSMNYCVESATVLPESILGIKTFQQKYKDIIWQMDQQGFTDKFEGDIILTPEVFCKLFGDLFGEIQGLSLIDKNSLFQEKLNQKIFNDKLTVKAISDHPDLVNKEIFNDEGYLNIDDYIIKEGILKNFIVSEYVANRSGLELNPIATGNFIVDAGDVKLEDMIKSVKKGILVNGISSGNPNKDKDFSGVIKNSYYIEDGEIKYPISEVMLTANIVEMFNNIESVSEERLNIFSACIVPWMKISGVNISGK